VVRELAANLERSRREQKKAEEENKENEWKQTVDRQMKAFTNQQRGLLD
jgi:hypothetical protein